MKQHREACSTLWWSVLFALWAIAVPTTALSNEPRRFYSKTTADQAHPHSALLGRRMHLFSFRSSAFPTREHDRMDFGVGSGNDPRPRFATVGSEPNEVIEPLPTIQCPHISEQTTTEESKNHFWKGAWPEWPTGTGGTVVCLTDSTLTSGQERDWPVGSSIYTFKVTNSQGKTAECTMTLKVVRGQDLEQHPPVEKPDVPAPPPPKEQPHVPPPPEAPPANIPVPKVNPKDWWVHKLPWWLPAPPEWGKLPTDMYTQYYHGVASLPAGADVSSMVPIGRRIEDVQESFTPHEPNQANPEREE